ncbi:MAG TPA: tyrosine-type recombinase/integrase [Streptosporangiaceae bacterium]|nr:tyrosine-type recombinase/integrase [Streptosporangiaceae bacterium]
MKSKAGKRIIGLPAQLVALLQEHRTQQDAEQAAARQFWQDEGWVFASPTGGALNPNTDYHEWKTLLAEEAGLREGRLHDARHTAATVLLLLEVPLQTVMSIMGWSSVDMVARYQYITDIRQKVAGQVDQVIWQTTSAPGEPVTVQREALAAILPVVDVGLAHSDIEALADPHRPSGGYRPFSISRGQPTGGG